MDSTQLCRLCLQSRQDVVNVWKTFQDSTIATILAKHFWFQVNKNDGLTEWLCKMCWIQTKAFHEFYVKVERFQKSYWDSIKVDGGDNDETAVIESEFSVVKCEDTELTLEEIHSQIDEGNDFEYNDNCDDTPHNMTPSGRDSQIDDKRKALTEFKASSVSEPDKHINETIKEEVVDAQIKEWFTMKCDICSNITFKSLLELRCHYRKVHKVRGYVTCCDKKFLDRPLMIAHIQAHTNPDKLINQTIRAEVDAQIVEWFTMKCDICSNVTFKSLSDLRCHYRKVHKVRGYVTCCDKKFDDRPLMIAHLRDHTNPDTYRCEQCNRNFKTKYSFKIHIGTHVPIESRPFKCSLCSKAFTTEAILRRHNKTNHPTEDGEFLCKKCNKNYRSEILLKTHIRDVHASLGYVCEVCARQFRYPHTLRHHVISEHSETPQPKIQCDICGGWFKCKYALTRHMKEQHLDTKPVTCTICSKVLRNKHRLKPHIRIFHSQRRYECKLCDKTFKRNKNLKEHVATHTGEDLYECQYCDKKFKSSANMYSHRKNSHLAEWTRDNKKPATATKVEN